MKTSRLALVGTVLALASAGWAQTTQPAGATEDDVILADFFWRQTPQLLQSGTLGVQLSAQLMESAVRLSPEDLPLLRNAIDVQLLAGDRERVAQLLAQYRKLDPQDELTLVQSIDLKVASLEAADEREKYLADLVDRDALSKAVRSHVATLLQGTYRDRGKDALANEALDKAIKLDGTNARALQVKYEQTYKTMTAPQRAAMLASMINANPKQPAVCAALGRELSQVGAYRESAEWFNRSAEMLSGLGVQQQGNDLADFAAVLLLAGDSSSAAKISEFSLSQDAFRSDALFLRLLADRSATGKTNEQSLTTARLLMMKRLDAIRVQLIGPAATQPSATQPADSAIAASTVPATQPALPPLPDIAGDMLKLKDARDELKNVYMTWLADWSWLDVYYSEKPADSVAIDSLAAILGEDHVAVARLRGWSLWRAGQIEPAKLKLNAVADRDPLAELGSILIGLASNEDKAALTTRAGVLYTATPDGMAGAMIWSSLHTLADLKLDKPDHDAVVKAVKVSNEWADMYKSPRAAYLLQLDPQKASYGFGEPVWATVTISNTGSHPLSVQPGGVIEPTVLIDANVRSLSASGNVPVAAVAQFTRKIVLQPRESVKAQVRLDGGMLGSALMSDPSTSVMVTPNVTTNFKQTEKGVFTGPGGMVQRGNRVFERVAVRVGDPAVRQDLYTRLYTGPIGQRMQVEMLLGMVSGQLAPQAESSPDAKKLLGEINEALDHVLATNQPPGFRALALMHRMARVQGADREAALTELRQMPQWQCRVMAAVAISTLPPEERLPLLQQFAANDPDEQVRNVAKLILQIPATTQPTATQPSTAPLVAPTLDPITVPNP